MQFITYYFLIVLLRICMIINILQILALFSFVFVDSDLVYVQFYQFLIYRQTFPSKVCCPTRCFRRNVHSIYFWQKNIVNKKLSIVCNHFGSYYQASSIVHNFVKISKNVIDLTNFETYFNLFSIYFQIKLVKRIQLH